jgi:hypothetical protein
MQLGPVRIRWSARDKKASNLPVSAERPAASEGALCPVELATVSLQYGAERSHALGRSTLCCWRSEMRRDYLKSV